MLYHVLSNLFEAWFTHLIHCRRPTLWIISDVFFPSSILEITYFKRCLQYLTLKFRMIPASQGSNWEVIFLGKNRSLMFLRFPWRVLGWERVLSRNNSLRSKAVRTWIMISVASMFFAEKILHAIRFRKIRQFLKASWNFNLFKSNRFTYLESTRRHEKCHSKSLFWFLNAFILFSFIC